VTSRPTPWGAVSKYLADFADAKPSAADYAMKVRKVFDMLVEDTGDAAGAGEFLLSHVKALIRKNHRPRRQPSGRSSTQTERRKTIDLPTSSTISAFWAIGPRGPTP
jgi:hypothetical protein